MAELLPAQQATLALLADIDQGRVVQSGSGPQMLVDGEWVRLDLSFASDRGWLGRDGVRWCLTQRGLDVLTGRRSGNG